MMQTIIEQVPKDFNPSVTNPGYLTRNRLLKSILSFRENMTGRMMDFGCGSKPYKSIFKVTEYIGVDYENPGHPHTNEQIDVYYDGKTLPFPENHFDSIFSTEVIEHIFNLPEILKELNRVLKPGGKILLTCPFAICEHEIPNDFARYTSFAMKHLMETHGFKVITIDKTGNNVETIWQLRIMYWHQHILVKFRKIPVLRSALRLSVYTLFNLCALFWSKIMPDRKDLYLNNIVLAIKNAA